MSSNEIEVLLFYCKCGEIYNAIDMYEAIAFIHEEINNRSTMYTLRCPTCRKSIALVNIPKDHWVKQKLTGKSWLNNEYTLKQRILKEMLEE